MKAAKRASQIKGFMRFSFFKQALRAKQQPIANYIDIYTYCGRLGG
jgi:hypothetical protein